MENYISEYQRWKNSNKIPADMRAELEAIEGNDDELLSRFGGLMSFGTAGLREKMCVGRSVMNAVTVAHATKALALVILEENAADKGVVVGYDSRNNSELFARTTAAVMAECGIKTYLFDELRPTPMLSYAIRALGCVAGVNITASHNPKQYNGYKAFWSDGAQLSAELAGRVAAKMTELDVLDDVDLPDFDKAVADKKITIIGKDIDETYMAAVLGEAVDANIIRDNADDLNIVYTPLAGAGYRIIPEVLKRAGIKNLSIVPSQAKPDGDFPTTPKPNPEYKQVFEDGIVIAKEQGAKLIIATDPDADRVGIVVLSNDGDYVCLTGNQVGALLTEYIINSYKERGCMPDKPYVVKTIVTSSLAGNICEANGVELCDVLTGFKYIGEKIEEKDGNFLLGFEESYGYLKGTYARDKDAVIATLLICEMAAYYMKRDMTLYDALLALYERYGFYLEGVGEKYFEGVDGKRIMEEKMNTLRNAAPAVLGGEKIVEVRDYKANTVKNVVTGEVSETGLPVSDVLYYKSEKGNVTVVRPSGTEPKIKFYYLMHAATRAEAESVYNTAQSDIMSIML